MLISDRYVLVGDRVIVGVGCRGVGVNALHLKARNIRMCGGIPERALPASRGNHLHQQQRIDMTLESYRFADTSRLRRHALLAGRRIDDVIVRLAGLTRRRKNGALIILENLQPIFDVARMIVHRCRNQS